MCNTLKHTMDDLAVHDAQEFAKEILLNPKYLIYQSNAMRLKFVAYLREYLRNCDIDKKSAYAQYAMEEAVDEDRFEALDAFIRGFMVFYCTLEKHRAEIEYDSVHEYIQTIQECPEDAGFMRKYGDCIEDLKIIRLLVVKSRVADRSIRLVSPTRYREAVAV